MTPGVNFTNSLRAAFTRADPKSAIKLLNLTVFFVLLGSSSIKDARRMLMKLTPGSQGSLLCNNDDDDYDEEGSINMYAKI